MIIKPHIASIMDMIFPRPCAGCANAVGDEARYLCWTCISRLQVVRQPFCEICGFRPEGAVEDGFVCSACSGKRPLFDRARSAMHYTGIAREIIHDFKYRNAIWLADDIASIMAVSLKTHLPDLQADVVVPVPLHRTKRRERSYNQAHLLAKRIAACLHKPARGDMLYRVRPTKSQTRLTASERRVNVRNVFSAGKAKLCNRLNVLLVDDVMTTGATLNECAGALKAAGARKVSALTAARG